MLTKKGFTMVEVIVVVVLMMILASGTVLGISEWQRWSAFRKQNDMAQTLYLNLQNQLTRRIENGREQELLGPKIRSVHRVKGCPSCNYTGYQGRIAIHEVLVIDRNVRNMILNHASIDEIRTYAETNQKMHSLRESALAMVERGITTTEEFKKITYYI